MYNVSEEYKNQVPMAGKIKDTIIEIKEEKLTVGEIDILTVDEFNNLLVNQLIAPTTLITDKIIYRFKSSLFKTVMKEIELEVKGQISLIDKIISLKNGLQVNGKFEYINFGDFIVRTTEEVKDKETVKVTAYDNMLKFMIDFDLLKLKIKLPCTIKEFAKALGEYCGVELYTEDFFNNEIIIDEDYFTVQKMTCRDVLEKLAQSTLCTIFIKENKLYFSNINETNELLKTDVLKNLKLQNKFGPINSFVLGRGDVEDNVYDNDEQSIAKNGLCEIRFDENEILDNKREQVIKNMFNHIKELEYYPFEAKELGLGYFEPCDMIKCQDKQQNEYKCLVLNVELVITSGTTETISSSIPTTTTTEYKYATKEEKANLRTWRLTKKNEGKIEDVVEQTSENNNKITKHEQTIDTIKDTLKLQETKMESVVEKANTVEEIANNMQKEMQVTTEKVTEVEKTVDGVTQSVSKVETNVADNYYTKKETNSKISQSAENINMEVKKKVGENEIISKINQSAEKVGINADKIELSADDVLNLLAGNTINLSSKNINISSDTLQIDSAGNMVLKGREGVANLKIVFANNTNRNMQLNPSQLIFKNATYGHEIMLYNATNGAWLKLNSGSSEISMINDGEDFTRISLSKGGKETQINAEDIKTPKLLVKDEYGSQVPVTGIEGHKYRVDWNASEGRLHFYVDVTDVGNVSDERLKKDIKQIDEDLIKAIGELDYKQFKKDNRNGQISVGVIAQDLIKILKKYNKNAKDYEILEEFRYKLDDETKYYKIDYEQFLILRLIAKEREIKELQQKDKERDKQIIDLNQRIEVIEKGDKQ